jgi:prolyl oligopeptidase
MTKRDKYKYLENTHDDSVIEFYKNETKETHHYLKNNKNKDLRNDIDSCIYYGYKDIPKIINKYIFWRDYIESEKSYILISKKGNEKEKIIIKSKTAIIKYIPSPLGNYIIYFTDNNGDEVYQPHIIDSTGKKINDDILNDVDIEILLWSNDENFFYYKKKIYLIGDKNDPSSYKYDIYIHKIEEDKTKDKRLIRKNTINDNFFKKPFIYMDISKDSRWLSIRLDDDKGNISLLVKDNKKNITHTIYSNINYIHASVIKNGKIYLYENKDNEFGYITVIDFTNIENKIYKSKILINPKKYLLDFFYCTKDYIYCLYIKNVSNYIKIYDYEGKFIRNLKFREKGNIFKIESYKYSNDIYIQFSSFTMPYSNYKYSFDNDKLELKYTPKVEDHFNYKNYSLKYEYAISKDGTKIPMFIIFNRKNKLKNISPAILYGYGSFGISQIPKYVPYILPFLNDGGIYIHSIIRGGEEFGDKWHTSAKGAKNKKKSFEDFIACSEYLIKKGYTDKNNLAIYGVSAGGLLVAASMIMRPDLYKCVISEMPIIDMVHLNRYIDEYGDPSKDKDLNNILKWDPLNNIIKKVSYPDILILGAENDSRAEIPHALKFTAKLKDYSYGKTLLYIKNNSGHSWNSVDKYYLIYDFLYKELLIKR